MTPDYINGRPIGTLVDCVRAKFGRVTNHSDRLFARAGKFRRYPSKDALFRKDLDPSPSNTRFLQPTRVYIPITNGVSIA